MERVLGSAVPVATVGNEHHSGVLLVEELSAQGSGIIVALHFIVDSEVYFGLLSGLLFLSGKSYDAGPSNAQIIINRLIALPLIRCLPCVVQTASL